MDGINGMTGGYSLVVLLSLTYLNHQLGFVDPDFLGVVLLAVFVFNIFNFRKDAKCFAGDVGAISIAFITLFLVGRLIIATQDITYLLLLAVYGVDTGLTILHRLGLGERITEPHRKHLYQILVNEMNLSHIGVSSLYMGLQLSVSVGLVFSENEKWAYSFCCLGILGIGYRVIYIRNKVRVS